MKSQRSSGATKRAPFGARKQSVKRAPSHARRQELWLRLCPPATRTLVALVDARLAPLLEHGGFCRVECQLHDPEISVKGSEILLERPAVVGRQYIEFVFEKYRSPRFAVRCGEMQSIEPGIFETPYSTGLVRRPGQTDYWWGKPWWRPNALWSDSDAETLVTKLVPMMSQILDFLDSGQRGPNIAEPFVPPPPRAGSAAST